MSGAFAIAAVTAVLKDLLNNGLVDHNLSAIGNVAISALPPDRIPTTNAEEKSQLNLFLFQVTPNQGWRNDSLPSRGTAGERLTNPPLALDLRYLVTAYGEKEFHAEALLGYAMQLLHENPVLTRDMIRATLSPNLPPEVTLPPGLSMLSTSDLAEQVELIKITPQYMTPEEMSRLWSAMQAKYRPTAVYHASVVLIQANKPALAPLPVLKQGAAGAGPVAQGSLIPPFPEITAIALPKNQTQALPSDAVSLSGHDLAGPTGKAADAGVVIRLASPRLAQPVLITVPAADRSAGRVAFHMPPMPGSPPAGVYALSAVVTPNGKPDEARASNEVALALAPRITGGLAGVIARTAVDPVSHLGTATVTLNCVPNVLPEQRVSLVLGAKEVQAQPHAAPTGTLSFIAIGMPAGAQRVRLRIDGAESVLIDRTDPGAPKFDETQKLVLS